MFSKNSLKRYYLTTAIDYPNGAPHIGHAYEKVITDCYARWYALLGYNVRLTTGSDENGQKLVKSSQDAGESTLSYVNRNSELFLKLSSDLDIMFTDFIRSTESRHIQVVQQIWNTLEENGDIYLGKYAGNYCISCESFYSEAQAIEGHCPVHDSLLSHMEEDGYFFRLSKYQDWILNFIQETPDFLFPYNVQREIISRLENDTLHDLSISRPNTGWGIQVPNDPKYVIYTWFDALICYYTSSQVDSSGQKRESNEYWPADMHVIGRDISWFHAVIWIAMLKGAGLDLPRQIYVHGMVLGSDGKRMSKTLGNGIDPQQCLKLLPSDSFRYYLLKSIASGQDGSFHIGNMIKAHNLELANDFGNLVLRVIKLTIKHFGNDVRAVESVDFKLDLFENVFKQMQQREHHKALAIIWSGVNDLNAYLNAKEPWKLKDDKKEFMRIMYTSLVNLNQLAFLLVPFIPRNANKVLDALGSSGSSFERGFLGANFSLKDINPLFPKIEDDN